MKTYRHFIFLLALASPIVGTDALATTREKETRGKKEAAQPTHAKSNATKRWIPICGGLAVVLALLYKGGSSQNNLLLSSKGLTKVPPKLTKDPREGVPSSPTPVQKTMDDAIGGARNFDKGPLSLPILGSRRNVSNVSIYDPTDWSRTF